MHGSTKVLPFEPHSESDEEALCTPTNKEFKLSSASGQSKAPLFEKLQTTLNSLSQRTSVGLRKLSLSSSAPRRSRRSIVLRDCSSETCDKWEKMSLSLLERDDKHRFWNASTKLPEEIIATFNDLESKFNIVMNDDIRMLRYQEFVKKASGFDIMHIADAEYLMRSTFGQRIGPSDLKCVTSAFFDRNDVNNGFLNFDQYANLVFEVEQAVAAIELQKTREAAIRSQKLKLPVDPESNFKRIWDVLCILLLLYCAFYIPYSIAFESEHVDVDNAFSAFNIVIDCLFMIDIGLSFVTAYDDQGFLVTDLHRISRHYFNTWFWPDLAGSFPFDVVVGYALKGSGNTGGGTLTALKFVRMLRLVRAWKFLEKLRKLSEIEGFEVFGSLSTLLRAFFLLIFSAHMLGCFFTMVLSVNPEYNWLIHYDSNLQYADVSSRYLISLYWAIISLTTMGYGDVVPVNNSERIFVVFVAVVGAVIFSHCIGIISSLITQVTGVEDRFRGKLRSVQEYLQYRELPAGLARRLKLFYQHCWRRSAQSYEELDILRDLGNPLKAQVFRAVGACVADDLPVLSGFDDEVIGAIHSRLQKMSFQEGDIIYSRGSVGNEMYFIHAGYVSLHVEGFENAVVDIHVAPVNDGSSKFVEPVRILISGDTFGEFSLFPKQFGRFRVETAIARSWGMAYSLSESSFLDIYEQYPEIGVRFRELCEAKNLEWKILCSTLNIDPQQAHTMPSSTGRTCQFRARADAIRADLLRHREATWLLPQTSHVCRDVLRLHRISVSQPGKSSSFRERPRLVKAGSSSSLRSVLSNGNSSKELVPPIPTTSSSEGPTTTGMEEISCVISEEGEVLCIAHTDAGLEASKPESLGFVWPGKTAFKVLDKSETETFDLGERKTFGCSLTLSPVRFRPGRPSVSESVRQFYMWSPEMFANFRWSFNRCVQSLPVDPADEAPAKARPDGGPQAVGQGWERRGSHEPGPAAGSKPGLSLWDAASKSAVELRRELEEALERARVAEERADRLQRLLAESGVTDEPAGPASTGGSVGQDAAGAEVL